MAVIGRAVTLVLVALVGLSGCATLRDLPLPGLVSGPTFGITAHFPSALGLPEQAAVRYNGAVVGEVVSVRTADYAAVVDLRISQRVPVPTDVHAEIRFSSPMGEAFVELTDRPGKGPRAGGTLRAGSDIPLAATSAAPSATDLLASVSTVITGGSFADMKVIIDELNTALTGNAPNVRLLVKRLDGTLTRLNDHTADFDRALSSLDRLSTALVGDRALIDEALTALEPAVRTLSEQSGQILTLMTKVRQLSRVGTATITRTRASLTSVLRDLGPVLDTLERNEQNFRSVFEGIHDFGVKSGAASRGLFTNFDLTLLIKLSDLVDPPGNPPPAPAGRR
ncbi:MAG: MlaD family protein [Propionibacteriales bacterium]|nr:MlaD family protein [Propionibacteriales bacterium]